MLLCILLSSCAVKKNAPSIDTYTIKNQTFSTLEIKTQNFPDKILKIAKPISTKNIQSNRILYSKNKYDRDAYAYGRWSDTPNIMLQNNFIYSIGQNHIFKAVLLNSSNAKTDYILESYLYDFYHDFLIPNRSKAVIRLGVHLIEKESKKVVASKLFSLSKQAKSENIQGGVEALNSVTNELTQELINWLKKVK
jgi:cholesterol transport system auxiliary component